MNDGALANGCVTCRRDEPYPPLEERVLENPMARDAIRVVTAACNGIWSAGRFFYQLAPDARSVQWFSDDHGRVLAERDGHMGWLFGNTRVRSIEIVDGTVWVRGQHGAVGHRQTNTAEGSYDTAASSNGVEVRRQTAGAPPASANIQAGRRQRRPVQDRFRAGRDNSIA